jgi:hypothetical protein
MVQHVTDAVPHLGVLAALAGLLPPVAAAFSIVWIAIQITEKVTGKPAHVLLAPVIDRVKALWKRVCS